MVTLFYLRAHSLIWGLVFSLDRFEPCKSSSYRRWYGVSCFIIDGRVWETGGKEREREIKEHDFWRDNQIPRSSLALTRTYCRSTFPFTYLTTLRFTGPQHFYFNVEWPFCRMWSPIYKNSINPCGLWFPRGDPTWSFKSNLWLYIWIGKEAHGVQK